MPIQDTSLFAYSVATQNRGKKQKEVLDALRFFPDATNAEIAERLGWPVNRVTPRTGELIKMGLIFKVERRTCKATNGTAWSLRAKHPVFPTGKVKRPTDSFTVQHSLCPERARAFCLTGAEPAIRPMPPIKREHSILQVHYKDTIFSHLLSDCKYKTCIGGGGQDRTADLRVMNPSL